MWKKIRPYLIQTLIVLAILTAGFFIAKNYLDDTQVAPKTTRSDRGLLVSIETYPLDHYDIHMESTGTVSPAKSIKLKNETSGRITWIHPNFYPGGKIKKGEPVIRISTEDYAITLDNQRITLRQREADLAIEKAKGAAAGIEFDLLQKTFDHVQLSQEEQNLVKRVPQLQNAIAMVETAKNNVRQAELNVERSTVKAPFDLVISEKNVEVGDYVGGQTALASVVSTEAFWIVASIFPEQLQWIGIPGVTAENSTNGKITYEMANKIVERSVSIRAILPQVESLGRMVQVLLEVQDPLGEPTETPLLLGTFVKIYLEAKDKIQAIRLPRNLVHEGNKVYIYNNEKKLDIREVTAGWKDNDFVYVTKGIQPGEKIVTTLISSPVSGTKLRLKDETPNEKPHKGKP